MNNKGILITQHHENSKLQKNALKFTPLRLVILEPGGSYRKTVVFAIMGGLANVFIGAVACASLLYTVETGDVHAALCCFAYSFFSAEAILSLNHLNGWSTPMRSKHRKCMHVLLQICAMVSAVMGTVLISMSNGMSNSPHGIAGIITTVLAGCSVLSGPCSLYGGRKLSIVHMGFGMPTFLMSSLCLCLGLYLPAFRSWAGYGVPVLVGFVIFYTIFIIAYVFTKWFYMIRRKKK